MRIYADWTQDEYEEFVSYDWGITDGWEDDCWASHFLCCNFKKEWTCQELMESLKSESLTESQVKEKYLK